MVKDPNFSGDYAELIGGKHPTKKKRNTKQKEIPQKSNEWERDEKTLMRDMDIAFNSLSQRPQLAYKLPQLPAPKNIDPRDIVGSSEVMSLKSAKPKKRKVRKVRKSKKVVEPEPEMRSEPELTSVFPTASKPKRTRRSRKKAESSNKSDKSTKTGKAKSKDDVSPGRLIPIVKRTKRVKKVNS